MTHPFRGLPSFQFWNSGVAEAAPGALDPMIISRFQIKSTDRVATIGSCFAQHISRHLVRRGLNYFITEAGDPTATATDLSMRNYGTFSARYGNVYTVRQATQLIDRAFGHFRSTEVAWKTDGGGFVDPFRPQIEPTPWSSIEQVIQSRDEHLLAVRRVFLESDVLVFTLGLTEAFISKDDGAVFPVAPGVAGGSFSPERHQFQNFSFSDVISDLELFVSKTKTLNPKIKIILTVSPVPLIATFEPRHVLVSTTISKATLRVAAHEITQKFDFVEYFPSYEIISGSAAGASYFENDLRQVRQVGVDHVMRIFEKHMMHGTALMPSANANPTPTSNLDSTIICDEDIIINSMKMSGL